MVGHWIQGLNATQASVLLHEGVVRMLSKENVHIMKICRITNCCPRLGEVKIVVMRSLFHNMILSLNYYLHNSWILNYFTLAYIIYLQASIYIFNCSFNHCTIQPCRVTVNLGNLLRTFGQNSLLNLQGVDCFHATVHV